MEIRKYKESDIEEITELFYNTVHTVNAKDYSKEQLDAWAPKNPNLEKWNISFQNHTSVIAVEDNTVIGFGDIDKSGYLDRLYVHKDYQRRGAATLICNYLEESVKGNITTHASITAKPFFFFFLYKTVKKQSVERNGVTLTNYVMEKER